MNPSETQKFRTWLEDDLMVFIHLRRCVEQKYGQEQIAGLLRAIVNGIIEKGEWEIDPEQVNWMELANEVVGTLNRRAQAFIRESKSSAHPMAA